MKWPDVRTRIEGGDYAQAGSAVLLDVVSDRIEITSPGTLPNHRTVAQATGGGSSRSRNEMMANAMVVRRLMERRGKGWLLMRRGMRELNGTEPELINEVDGGYVRVRFRTRSIAGEPEC